jgi:hypothetical protein
MPIIQILDFVFIAPNLLQPPLVFQLLFHHLATISA